MCDKVVDDHRVEGVLVFIFKEWCSFEDVSRRLMLVPLRLSALAGFSLRSA